MATHGATNMKYAGIGSRETPEADLKILTNIGYALAKRGWILRSGGADGADTAFELGSDSIFDSDYLKPREPHYLKEIYLPWKKFNGHTSELWRVEHTALVLAASIHPAWGVMGHGGKLCHARNCYQILGYELNDPVDLVICWTLDGKVQGGTRTAIKLAESRGIPVINLGEDISQAKFISRVFDELEQVKYELPNGHILQ